LGPHPQHFYSLFIAEKKYHSLTLSALYASPVHSAMMDESDATRRLNVKKQTLDDAYAVPANFLEIDVVNPMTSITAGKKRYTDYEVRMRVSIKTHPFLISSSAIYDVLIVDYSHGNRWSTSDYMEGMGEPALISPKKSIILNYLICVLFVCLFHRQIYLCLKSKNLVSDDDTVILNG
jgi:hypothetical protein